MTAKKRIAGAAVLLAVAALLAVWVLTRAADPKKASFEAVSSVLFALPDPKMQLVAENLGDEEGLRTALAKADPEMDFAARVSPYCTGRGLEMLGNLNRTLGVAGAGTQHTAALRSAELLQMDGQGAYPFTVTVVYGAGQDGDGRIFTLNGSVGFDGAGLIDYFYIPNRDSTAFVQSAA